MKLFVPANFIRLARLHRSPGRCFMSSNSYDHTIAELNKEMELIFGEPAPLETPSGMGQQPSASSPNRTATADEEVRGIPFTSSETQGLTHVDSGGQAQMVDVSSKSDSKRVAVAGCRVILGQKAFNLVASNQMAKGDVLGVAKIAGISGAKQTSSLIPLCHNIGLSHVRVDLILNEKELSVDIEGEAATTGKTGVEMEAMTAVTVAGLTVYDMCKAASKEIRITDIRLEHKTGGKSGSWSRKK